MNSSAQLLGPDYCIVLDQRNSNNVLRTLSIKATTHNTLRRDLVSRSGDIFFVSLLYLLVNSSPVTRMILQLDWQYYQGNVVTFGDHCPAKTLPICLNSPTVYSEYPSVLRLAVVILREERTR